MKHLFRSLAAPLLGATLLLAGCARTTIGPDLVAAPAATVAPADATAASLTEAFETGSKASYASGAVTLASGAWTFNDALLGNASADVKTGAQAARLRNSGSLTMNFDLSGGAGTVTLDHARYGTDGSSTWELWVSTNGGASFSKVGGPITTSASTLQTASFAVNQAGALRLQVRKTDGSSNRLNLDNLTVQPAGSTGGGGTTPPPSGGKKFLFDASHAETAGNADWVLDVDGGAVPRFPTPAQSGITSSTPETYWTAALSAWGVALVKLGNSVENLPAGTAITYGNAANPQDLSNYSVFVVDEPNTLFTASEKNGHPALRPERGRLVHDFRPHHLRPQQRRGRLARHLERPDEQ